MANNSMIQLVASRGNFLYLLKEKHSGIIVDVEQNIRFPAQNLDSILKQGYWESIDNDPQTVQFLMSVPVREGETLARVDREKEDDNESS